MALGTRALGETAASGGGMGSAPVCVSRRASGMDSRGMEIILQPMKNRILKKLLLVIGAASLLAGCESYYDKEAASVSPEFPPAPPNALNAPQLNAMGADQLH